MGQSDYTCVFWLLMLLGFLGGGDASGKRWLETEKQRPVFGETEKNIEVMVGQNARLPCIVHHINDRAVTWLRRRDLHILTTGHHTYSADDRFQVVAESGGSSWSLLVRSAQPRDSGVYECQVNTDPKMSRPVTLTVQTEISTDPAIPFSVTKSKVFVANRTAVTRDGHLRVEIQGPSEVNIEEGSKLSLNCVVTSTLGAAAVVYWFHDSRLLDYGGPRGGVKLKIDQERGITAARLEVENVGMDDGGMYSCVPAGSHPASIRVHVHMGKQEAAIQQIGVNDTSSSPHLLPLPYLLPSFVFLSLLPTLPTFSYALPSSLPFLISLPLVLSSLLPALPCPSHIFQHTSFVFFDRPITCLSVFCFSSLCFSMSHFQCFISLELSLLYHFSSFPLICLLRLLSTVISAFSITCHSLTFTAVKLFSVLHLCYSYFLYVITAVTSHVSSIYFQHLSTLYRGRNRRGEG